MTSLDSKVVVLSTYLSQTILHHIS